MTHHELTALLAAILFREVQKKHRGSMLVDDDLVDEAVDLALKIKHACVEQYYPKDSA